MPGSLEVVIANGDVAYLASVLRGQIDAEDVEIVDTKGIEIGLQPSLFAPLIDDGEVLIEVRTPHYHLMGGCGGALAGQIADSFDGSSGIQVPVMLTYLLTDSPKSELVEVAVFFVAERRGEGEVHN